MALEVYLFLQVLAVEAEWPVVALPALVVNFVGVPPVGELQNYLLQNCLPQIVFKLKSVLKVFLKNEILNRKLRVGIAPDVDEGIKSQIRVSSEDNIAFSW